MNCRIHRVAISFAVGLALAVAGCGSDEREGVELDTDINAFFTGWVTLTQVPAN